MGTPADDVPIDNTPGCVVANVLRPFLIRPIRAREMLGPMFDVASDWHCSPNSCPPLCHFHLHIVVYRLRTMNVTLDARAARTDMSDALGNALPGGFVAITRRKVRLILRPTHVCRHSTRYSTIPPHVRVDHLRY